MAESSNEVAVIYVRVSTEEQLKGYSLQTQEERCREFAAQHEYAVVEVFHDSHSGEDLDRPDLNRMYSYAAANTVQVAIAFDTDRLSRGGPMHHGVIEAILERHGVRVEYVLGDYNENSPESKLSKLIKQSIAWYENQQRRERSTRGRRGMARAGRVVTIGNPLYGYQYEKGQMVINEEEAAIVRRIFALAAEGVTIRQIAIRLSNERIPTRADQNPKMRKFSAAGMWSSSMVGKMLRNETYVGHWHYAKREHSKKGGKQLTIYRDREEWIPVPAPAIIDEALFAKVQGVGETNRWLSTRNTKHDYLLRSILHCACGRVCGCEPPKKEGRSGRYRCQRQRQADHDPECPVKAYPMASALDAAVWNALIQMLSDERHLRAAIQAQRAEARTEQEPLAERLAALHTTKADVERKLGILMDQMLAGDFPRAIVEERKKLLLNTLRQVEAEIVRTESELAAAALGMNDEELLVAAARAFSANVAALTFEEKRQIVLLLQVRVDAITKTRYKISCLLPLVHDTVELERLTGKRKTARQASSPTASRAAEAAALEVETAADEGSFVSTSSREGIGI